MQGCGIPPPSNPPPLRLPTATHPRWCSSLHASLNNPKTTLSVDWCFFHVCPISLRVIIIHVHVCIIECSQSYPQHKVGKLCGNEAGRVVLTSSSYGKFKGWFDMQSSSYILYIHVDYSLAWLSLEMVELGGLTEGRNRCWFNDWVDQLELSRAYTYTMGTCTKQQLQLLMLFSLWT